MIPLGSCTMKLNATSEMMPVTWPEFGQMHPFAPVDQTQGISEIVHGAGRVAGGDYGVCGVSLQPNAGSRRENMRGCW